MICKRNSTSSMSIYHTWCRTCYNVDVLWWKDDKTPAIKDVFVSPLINIMQDHQQRNHAYQLSGMSNHHKCSIMSSPSWLWLAQKFMVTIWTYQNISTGKWNDYYYLSHVVWIFAFSYIVGVVGNLSRFALIFFSLKCLAKI